MGCWVQKERSYVVLSIVDEGRGVVDNGIVVGLKDERWERWRNEDLLAKYVRHCEEVNQGGVNPIEVFGQRVRDVEHG